ncbi:MAG TPA: hypothetical protein VFN50_07250, partial [Acidimicrobiales bacterium]|nr:hypothetical protein [Acidimicrobiales bacterium]
MASRNPFERYLSAGLALTQLTRQRAEEIVRDLVEEGEVGRENAEEWIEDLVARSRRGAEQLATLVRDEVRRQVDQLGLVNREDLTAAFDRVLDLARKAGEMTIREATRRAAEAGAGAARETEKLREEGERRARAAEKAAAPAKKP